MAFITLPLDGVLRVSDPGWEPYLGRMRSGEAEPTLYSSAPAFRVSMMVTKGHSWGASLMRDRQVQLSQESRFGWARTQWGGRPRVEGHNLFVSETPGELGAPYSHVVQQVPGRPHARLFF